MPDGDLAVIYRTTGVWGVGLGRNLTAAEVDAQFYAIAQAIVALQTGRPEPANIASITVAGRFMTITLDSGTMFGPFPLPVTEFRFRDEWTPLTIYNALDWFTVSGVGIFTVMYDHTSGAEFDPNILVDTLPGLKKLFGPDAGSIANSVVYDVEFIYLGHLVDITDAGLTFLALRSLIVPAAAVHAAVIKEPPSSADQVLPILHGAGVIGNVTFSIGSNTGVVTINADETIAIGDELVIGPPAAADGVAENMTIALALQRVLPPTS